MRCPYDLAVEMGESTIELSIEAGKAVRDERLGHLGCRCASCSTVAGLEFNLDGRSLRSGRKDNPVHNYLSMRAFAIDRIAGGGMGSFVYEGYVTLIALVLRLAKFPQGPQDYDDDYVVDVRSDATRIAVENEIAQDLGYSLDTEAIREHLSAKNE